jgi:hypothetical protein
MDRLARPHGEIGDSCKDASPRRVLWAEPPIFWTLDLDYSSGLVHSRCSSPIFSCSSRAMLPHYPCRACQTSVVLSSKGKYSLGIIKARLHVRFRISEGEKSLAASYTVVGIVRWHVLHCTGHPLAAHCSVDSAIVTTLKTSDIFGETRRDIEFIYQLPKLSLSRIAIARYREAHASAQSNAQCLSIHRSHPFPPS